MTERASSSPRAELDDAQIHRIIGGLAVAMFLAALDQTLVAVALLSIGRDLGDLDLMPWVIAAYLVAATISAPIFGKLSDLHGRWPMLAVALATGIGASLICALSPSMPMLIAARILQGIGGGSVIALVQTVVADIAPGARRGRYQGWFSGVYAAASVMGPVLGGLIAEYIGWRGIFLINLPTGVIAFVLARRALAGLPRTARKRPIDYAGAVLLAGGLSTLMIALTRLGQGVSWIAPSTLLLAAAGVLLLVLCAWREHHAPEPLLPPVLFTDPVLVRCYSLFGLAFFTLMGLSVLLPLWMQSASGLGLDRIAILLLPFTLSSPLAAFLAGRRISRGGRMRTQRLAGSWVTAAGLALLTIATPDALVWFVLGTVVCGLGMGMVMPATLMTVQSRVSADRMGIATASAGLFRSLGGALGVALLSAVLFGLAADDGPDRTGGAAALRAALTSGADASALQPAFQLTFVVATAVSLIALLIAWTIPAQDGRPEG
ncbi:MAG: MDR family MFS transporter [Burkholderiaceae bacterium]